MALILFKHLTVKPSPMLTYTQQASLFAQMTAQPHLSQFFRPSWLHLSTLTTPRYSSISKTTGPQLQNAFLRFFPALSITDIRILIVHWHHLLNLSVGTLTGTLQVGYWLSLSSRIWVDLQKMYGCHMACITGHSGSLCCLH